MNFSHLLHIAYYFVVGQRSLLYVHGGSENTIFLSTGILTLQRIILLGY